MRINLFLLLPKNILLRVIDLRILLLDPRQRAEDGGVDGGGELLAVLVLRLGALGVGGGLGRVGVVVGAVFGFYCICRCMGGMR